MTKYESIILYLQFSNLKLFRISDFVLRVSFQISLPSLYPSWPGQSLSRPFGPELLRNGKIP